MDNQGFKELILKLLKVYVPHLSDRFLFPMFDSQNRPINWYKQNYNLYKTFSPYSSFSKLLASSLGTFR